MTTREYLNTVANAHINGEAQVEHALSIVSSISNESERGLVLGELLNDIILDMNPALADFFDE